MAYTTTANIAAKLGRSLTTEETTYFSSVLSAGIDAYIERMTGVTFGSTVSTSVYVQSDGTSTLVIPTMHDITAVARLKDDGSEEGVAVDDYYTYPRGANDKLALKHINGEWEENAEYKITGELGYTAVPGDITSIATDMAVYALTENSNNYKSEKVGDWSATYAETDTTISPESLAILSGYQRLSRSI